MPPPIAWTPAVVERRLVAAFRFLPGHPVFSDHRRLRAAAPPHAVHTEALNWTGRFVGDRHDAQALLTWARCRATGESVRERYQQLGWSRASAERARARALERIVDALNAAKP